jgi:flavin reductase
MPFTSQDFRQVMGRFATGITVVTMPQPGGGYHGITVNSFTSVSLTPPLVLICIDKKTEAHKILPQVGHFCVNILTEDQEYLSNRFAGREPYNLTPFAGLNMTVGTTGSPIFTDGLGFADCKIVAAYDGGDHTIFLGEVLDIGYNDASDANPLLYFQSRYETL